MLNPLNFPKLETGGFRLPYILTSRHPHLPFALVHGKYQFLTRALRKDLFFSISRRVFAIATRPCAFCGGRSKGTQADDMFTKFMTWIRLATGENEQPSSLASSRVVRNGLERTICCRNPHQSSEGKVSRFSTPPNKCLRGFHCVEISRQTGVESCFVSFIIMIVHHKVSVQM